MIGKIEPIPKNIPDILRLAAIQGKLVPFIGAGVSQLGGCPNWNEFADATLNFFVEEGKLSHAQLDQVSSLSSRVKLSVALELQKQHALPIDFKKLLEPSLAKKKIGDEIYANLSKLATTFVTTNYDDWLDQNPLTPFGADEALSQSKPQNTPRHPFYKRNDISVENLDVPNAVFHIHGSICDQASMVLTTVDYLNCYEPDYDYEDRLKKLLIKLAQNGRIDDVLLYADRIRKLPGIDQLFRQLAEGAI